MNGLDDDENIYVVTEAYTTEKWALDYQHSGYAWYAVNARSQPQTNRQVLEVPTNFQIAYSSASMLCSPNDPRPYTVLESHTAVNRRRLTCPKSIMWAVRSLTYVYGHESLAYCVLASGVNAQSLSIFHEMNLFNCTMFL